MDEQSANTWHCEVCNEDHPVYTKPVACWEKDNRRISNLEVAVQRVEAQLRLGRPTPPGVFPPMGKADSGARADGMALAEHHKRDYGCHHPIFRMLSEGSAFERVGYVNGEGFRKAEDVMRDVHPSVGVATVDGKATCPKCPESVESRATYARVPAHAGPTLAEAAIFGHGRFAPLGDAYQPACAECKRTGILLHVSRGTSASWLVCDDCDKPSTPAESIAVERGGYAPKPIGESDAQTRNDERHGARCCSNQGHSHAIWCPNHDAPCAECDAKSTATVGVGGRDGCVPGDDAEKAAFRKATEERIADATRRMHEADARLTNASCSAGPIVGLDATLPPLPRVKCECGAVVPSETESMADHIKCKQSTPVAMLESERRMEDDATLGRALIALLSDFAGDHGDSEGAEDCLRRLLGEVRDARARNRPPLAHEGPCDHGVPCHTPAAMLGEAEGLAERIAILCGQVVVTEANAGHSLTDVYWHAADVGGLARQIARSLRAAQREAEAREGGR